MSYSIISVLALVLNLIINRAAFAKIRIPGGEQNSDQRAASRYRYFLIASNFYFVTDIAWGDSV